MEKRDERTMNFRPYQLWGDPGDPLKIRPEAWAIEATLGAWLDFIQSQNQAKGRFV